MAQLHLKLGKTMPVLPNHKRELFAQELMGTLSPSHLVAVAIAAALASCGGSGVSENELFVLYRNSVFDENMRIHVATFDALDGEAYNRGNCEQAQVLFQAQPGVKTKFWCEKGRFKK